MLEWDVSVAPGAAPPWEKRGGVDWAPSSARARAFPVNVIRIDAVGARNEAGYTDQRRKRVCLEAMMSVTRKTLKEAKCLARTTERTSWTGLALVRRLTGRAGSKVHGDPLANAILAEQARIAARQGEVGVWTGEAVEDVETGAPPDFAVRCRCRRRVIRRVGQGRGRWRGIRSGGVVERHGHARRELKQILEVMQLGLLMADAVLQCGHMMANGDCMGVTARTAGELVLR